MEKYIVYCCDGNRFSRTQLWYSIKTLRFYTGNDLAVYVMSYDKKIVPNGCIWIDANKYKEFIPEKPQGYVKSTMCFAKLLVPMMQEFKDASKVLYVDTDFEIVSKHFADIFNEDCNEAEALAIKETDRMCNGHSGKWRYCQVKELAALMPEAAKRRLREKLYVNSGLVLFNLDQIRQTKPAYADLILEAFAEQQKHPKICCMQDEDIFNMLFNIKIVDAKYAMQQPMWKDGSECYAIHYNQGKVENDYPPKKKRAAFPSNVFSKDEHGFTYSEASSKIYPSKVDIVYVVGKPDNCKDNYQLRCSLRSVAKHAKNVGRVIVAGYPPDWLSSNVLKVFVEDKVIDGVSGKHWNILNCLKQAILDCQLAKPFLYSSDDHFYMKDMDFSKHPRNFMTERLYSEEFLLYLMPDKKKWGWYLTNIVMTRAMLDLESLPCRWAAVHANTWIYPQYLLEVMRMAYAHKTMTPNVGFEPTCMFNALFERDWPCEKFERIPDNDTKILYADKFDAKLDKHPFVFTLHECLDHDDAARAKLEALFPEKCMYEKD